MALGFRHTALAVAIAIAPVGALAQTTTTTPAHPGAMSTAPGAGMTGPSSTAPSTTAPSSTAPGTMSRTPATSSMSSGSGPTHYASQSEAQSGCSGDTVVWASPRSKALHTSDSRYFGKSKHGFFACEKQAMSAGYHLAGTGHHKKATS